MDQSSDTAENVTTTKDAWDLYGSSKRATVDQSRDTASDVAATEKITATEKVTATEEDTAANLWTTKKGSTTVVSGCECGKFS